MQLKKCRDFVSNSHTPQEWEEIRTPLQHLVQLVAHSGEVITFQTYEMVVDMVFGFHFEDCNVNANSFEGLAFGIYPRELHEMVSHMTLWKMTPLSSQYGHSCNSSTCSCTITYNQVHSMQTLEKNLSTMILLFR